MSTQKPQSSREISSSSNSSKTPKTSKSFKSSKASNPSFSSRSSESFRNPSKTKGKLRGEEDKMKAQLITSLGEIRPDGSPLELKEVPRSCPTNGQVRLKIIACGVCHTELDEIEGRTSPPELPVIPGHQVVGTIEKFGPGIDSALQKQLKNQPVGVGWIYSACGQCRFCQEGRENLCPDFTATGRDRDGGYAEYMLVPVNYAIPLPPDLDPVQASPLLCAGSIGYRSLMLALNPNRGNPKRRLDKNKPLYSDSSRSSNSNINRKNNSNNHCNNHCNTNGNKNSTNYNNNNNNNRNNKNPKTSSPGQQSKQNSTPNDNACSDIEHSNQQEEPFIPAGQQDKHPISNISSTTGTCQLNEIPPLETLGLTGFGASGHLVLQLVKAFHPSTRVYVFARRQSTRDFAFSLGADWAGPTSARAPEPCQSIIDTTPAWLPVREALANLAPGGRLVINAIRKEAGDKDALQDLNYARHLWLEKEIKSVANVTRQDIRGILNAASKINLQPTLTEYSLEEAGQALKDIKFSRGRGAKVLKISTNNK